MLCLYRVDVWEVLLFSVIVEMSLTPSMMILTVKNLYNIFIFSHVSIYIYNILFANR